MFRMFKLIQMRPEGSDCTAPYKVVLNGDYTVEQFILDVLLDEREFGSIYTPGHEKICDYSHGNLLTPVTNEYRKLKVTSARAHGGWGCMDYTLTLEIVNGDFLKVTKHFGIRREDIYGEKTYVVYDVTDKSFAKSLGAFKNILTAKNECSYLERIFMKKKQLAKKKGEKNG